MSADVQSRPDEKKEISFVYTAQDFVDGYRLQGAIGAKSWLVVTLILGVLFALLCYAIPEWEWRLAISAVSGLGGAVAYVFARFWFYPRLARKQFTRQPLAQFARTIALTSDGFRIVSERGETSLRWSDFVAWRSDERSIILFTSPRIFLVIPTRLTDLGFPIVELKGAVARDFAMRS